MARPLIDLGPKPWLDIGSRARHGPGRRDRLSPAHIAAISRTVRRTPEVVLKMLNDGGRDLGSVARHLKYLHRDGELEIETDDGEPVRGRSAAPGLIDDWGLELDEKRPTADLKPRKTRKPTPKLVHKMVFSMPAGTPPKKVLTAVKSFAREEFGAKHRYAMVLHTDEPHPHVHLVVRAMGYDGQRLNIRKATLREWRREFARHLREQGVEANATERAVRGVTRPQKLDGIYRASLRGFSTHWRTRAAAVARELGRPEPTELGKAQLLETRRAIVRGWSDVADDLVLQNHVELALAVRDFAKRLPLVKTEREWIRDRILEQTKARMARASHRRPFESDPEQRGAEDLAQRAERRLESRDYTR
ncbi:MAG: relaxase/mobilization nuclease domain-containing protein [Steroidobacteraceae bacterium]